MSQALAITLWMASGAAIGGIVTPLVVQRKSIGTWRGMLAGMIMGLVGNVLVLLPLWLLLVQALPTTAPAPSWKQDVSEEAERRETPQPSIFDAARAAASRLFAEPSPYVVVFVILTLFTLMETGVAYLPDLPEGVRIGVLGFLAATKASLVLLYFMHLKSDYRLFALPFALGVVLVVPLILIVGLTVGEVSGPSAVPAARPATETSGGAPASQDQLVAEGKQLFSENCAMCHGAQAGAGPAFTGMVDRADNRVRGESAQQYIHQSIVDPSAYVVSGFQDMMPKDFAKKFSNEQINALVDYIVAQSGDEPPPTPGP
jgi:caa(3)-type oxidase subunit IV